MTIKFWSINLFTVGQLLPCPAWAQISKKPIALLFSCWLASFQLCKAALPSTETVGKLLGYPSSELLIEDITPLERALIGTPSRREQKKQTILPDPASLLKAYIIHGKNPNSFFPIQVYVGVKNAFLTSEVLDQLTNGAALPVPKGIPGAEEFAALGRGGAYFTPHHKVKSDIPPLNLPDLVAAVVTVLQPRGQELDIKIAQRAGLSHGEELQHIPGGEAYYNTFGPFSDQNTSPRLDVTTVFLELNKIMIAEWLAERTSGGVMPLPPAPLATPSKPPDPTLEPESPAPLSPRWLWWSGIIALVALVLIGYAVRRRHR